jgi:hypothetical protein
MKGEPQRALGVGAMAGPVYFRLTPPNPIANAENRSAGVNLPCFQLDMIRDTPSLIRTLQKLAPEKPRSVSGWASLWF